MTNTPGAGALPPSVLQPYANARILLFSNAIPGVLDSERTGRFLFEGFLKRLRGISSKENSPGVDTGDFTYEGYLTRGAVLPLTSSQPWDWLAADVAWSTVGIRPVSATTPALLTPCFGAVWLGPLSELRSPGLLPSPSRAQLAADDHHRVPRSDARASRLRLLVPAAGPGRNAGRRGADGVGHRQQRRADQPPGDVGF